MIKVATVILAHPHEKSFNHAIYQRAVRVLNDNNLKVYAHDLYEEEFNPVMPKEELGKQETQDKKVKAYAEEMLESDILVFIHPNWWGQPPAIMKGYIDRIFRPPYAYDETDPSEAGIGKLQGKVGIVFNTGNTEAKREEEYFKDPLENEWIRCVFWFCGIENGERKLYRIIAGSSEEKRKSWLNDVENTLKKYI
jgi:putative NADPH-quinone reductase